MSKDRSDAEAAEERARHNLPPWLAPPPDRAALARLKHCWVLLAHWMTAKRPARLLLVPSMELGETDGHLP